MRKSPKIGARLADLSTQLDNTKRLHEQLSAQAHKAGLQLDLERVSVRSRYDLIPARLNKPSMTKTLGLRAGIGLGLGLFLTVLIALIREARKHVHPPQGPGSSALVPRP
jgi:hypothetical protein